MDGEDGAGETGEELPLVVLLPFPWNELDRLPLAPALFHFLPPPRLQ